MMRILLLAVLAVAANLPAPSSVAQSDVASTLHNLSVSGPGEIRSVNETEVCKFCHIPHSAVADEPLWGHALSKVQQYRVPRVRGRGGVPTPAPQPDGSSRLCLSCHDGTVALGEIGQSRRKIRMSGSARLSPGRPGFIGTDLSGSHPISIVYEDHGADQDEGDMGLRPRASVQSDPEIKLDPRGKIQCTTCHDPHSDAHYREGETPRFWVKATVNEVCLSCHELR